MVAQATRTAQSILRDTFGYDSFRGFQSEVMREGTFTHTFSTPGTYDYTCTLHGQMKGRVIVTG